MFPFFVVARNLVSEDVLKTVLWHTAGLCLRTTLCDVVTSDGYTICKKLHIVHCMLSGSMDFFFGVHEDIIPHMHSDSPREFRPRAITHVKDG